MDLPLKNLWVVVTRPADQADGLITAIEKKGGHAIKWPALQIKSIVTSEQTRQHISSLKNYDHVIFISVNAVHHGLRAIADHQLDLNNMNVFAVGETTAKALKDSGIENVQIPEVASSEGLLAMPAFDETIVSEKRYLIFRGIGGNEKLAQGLNQRGAETVDYAEVYQRQPANSNPAILESHWQRKQLDIILVTSIAGLDNLFAILGATSKVWLCSTPLLTVSDRVAEYAHKKGFTHSVLIAKSARDEDIIATMQAWHQS